MHHQGRYDCGEYMIRSIFPRILVSGKTIIARKTDKKEFQRGDVIMVNEHMKHYQGEVQIVLKQMKNLGHHNYLGRIASIDIELLDEYKEERIFKFYI